MLEFIRKHRNLFSILFVVAGTAMVTTMFSDPYSGNGGGGNSGLGSSIVAKVDGEEISMQTLYQIVSNQRAQMQDNIEEQVAKSADKAQTRKFLDQLLKMQVSSDRVLAQLIQQKFTESTSARLGLEVPPDAVVHMLSNTPYFQKDGKFDPIRYKAAVSQPGIYEKEIRKEALIDTLRRSFVSSLTAMSPEEQKIEATLKKKHNFEVLSVNPGNFKEPVQLSDSEVSAFANDASQSTKLQSFYDRNIRKYKGEEQVHARHILLDEKAGGEKKASEILADIRAKKITFEDAAKQFSTDKSNAERGGDLGFFAKGAMTPAFEQAAFALKNNQDLADKPVKTEFGYHLIQRLDFKAASSKTLSDVKIEISREVLTEQRRSEKAAAWAKSIVDSGKAPSDADIKKLGLTWTPVAWTPLDASLGNVGNVDEQRAKILTLTAAQPYLKEVLRQGENLVILRWANAPKADPKSAAPSAETDLSPNQLAQDKAVSALSYYLQEQRTRLEKSKKIVKNESALAQIKAALGDNEGGGDFGGLPLGGP